MSQLLPLFVDLAGRRVLLVGAGRVAAAKLGQLLAACDDPANAAAFLSGVIRRDGVTLAISTGGAAPGLTALLREGLDAVLPRDLGAWLDEARRQRVAWRREGVPMHERRPLLLEALTRLYAGAPSEAPRPGDTGPAKVASGHVSLVGAGPGDPGLLTRCAVARL